MTLKFSSTDSDFEIDVDGKRFSWQVYYFLLMYFLNIIAFHLLIIIIITYYYFVLFSHKGICKLPFIDEERLLSETTKLEKDLGVCMILYVTFPYHIFGYDKTASFSFLRLCNLG